MYLALNKNKLCFSSLPSLPFSVQPAWTPLGKGAPLNPDGNAVCRFSQGGTLLSVQQFKSLPDTRKRTELKCLGHLLNLKLMLAFSL